MFELHWDEKINKQPTVLIKIKLTLTLLKAFKLKLMKVHESSF